MIVSVGGVFFFTPGWTVKSRSIEPVAQHSASHLYCTGSIGTRTIVTCESVIDALRLAGLWRACGVSHTGSSSSGTVPIDPIVNLLDG